MRPEKRNAMSPTLNRRMLEVLDELEFRDDVGVLVLGGEGTAWSAGMDLKEYFRETEAKGLRGVPVSGQDADFAALNRIALGTQTATIFKDSRELGREAASAALALAQLGGVGAALVGGVLALAGQQCAQGQR
eukprot:gene4030-5149_t